MIWTRAQILRLNSACGRRCDRRRDGWPYPLNAIPHINDFGEDHVNSVIERLLHATRREFDVYSLGVRTKHPSRECLLSAQSMHLPSVDFEMHTYGIDFQDHEATLGECCRCAHYEFQCPQLHERLRHHAGGFAEAAKAQYQLSSSARDCAINGSGARDNCAMLSALQHPTLSPSVCDGSSTSWIRWTNMA